MTSTNDYALPSADLPNIHDGLGLSEPAAARISSATIQAIGAAGFELQGQIGRGAFGVVFEGREKKTVRKVAIKVTIDSRDERSRGLFERERRILASEFVPSDLVVGYLTSKDEPGIQPFIVLEHIDGRPILEYVEHPRPMAMADRIDLIETMLRGVHRLHECNILHRDLSPKNVLVSQGDRIRFIDFGQSCRIEQGYHSLQSVGGPKGTPTNATRHLLSGGRGGRPDDIRAAAAIAFPMLTRKFAKSNGDPDNYVRWRTQLADAKVPKPIRQIVLQAEAKNNETKIGDLNAQLVDLNNAMQGARHQAATDVEAMRQNLKTAEGQTANVRKELETKIDSLAKTEMALENAKAELEVTKESLRRALEIIRQNGGPPPPPFPFVQNFSAIPDGELPASFVDPENAFRVSRDKGRTKLEASGSGMHYVGLPPNLRLRGDFLVECEFYIDGQSRTTGDLFQVCFQTRGPSSRASSQQSQSVRDDATKTPAKGQVSPPGELRVGTSFDRGSFVVSMSGAGVHKKSPWTQYIEQAAGASTTLKIQRTGNLWKVFVRDTIFQSVQSTDQEITAIRIGLDGRDNHPSDHSAKLYSIRIDANNL